MVNDIIDFNRIESGNVPVARGTFILQDLVEELQTLFSGSMDHKGVEFEVQTDKIDRSAFGDGTRLVIVGDEQKIKRSCINLLSNVCYYYYLENPLISIGLQIYCERKSYICGFDDRYTAQCSRC